MKQEINVVLTGTETTFCLPLRNNLHNEGYKVSLYFDTSKALRHCKKKDQAFCILTGSLSEDILGLIRKVRTANHSIVIIAIDEKAYSTDKAITAFRAGVDIYLSKPFILAELIHRMGRMRTWISSFSSSFPAELSVGGLLIKDRAISTADGNKIWPLTVRQHEVITMLAYYKNSIVHRKQVLLTIWGSEDYFLTRSLDVMISRLRRYLKLDGSVILETIHGIGFRLREAAGTKSPVGTHDNPVIKCVRDPILSVP